MNRPMTASIDALCLGRAGLDLYANEVDTDFANVAGFHRHVGGSPANIAIGLAIQGVRVGFIGRLSDDMVGRYVESALTSLGVDTRGVTVDTSGTRTSLALTEMRAEHCGVVIYRHSAADLALCPEDIDAELVAQARLLVVSGTALSSEPSRSAVQHTITIARQASARVVLDLDYRAYTWESFDEACSVCSAAAGEADVVIGNAEEIELLRQLAHAAATGAEEVSAVPDLHSDPHSDRQLVEALHGAGVSLVCIKAGEAGSTIYPAGAEPLEQPAFPVAVVKPFGAGDAYAATLCAGLLADAPLALTVRRAAAAAAIVVGSHSCGDATPTLAAIDTFLESHHA